MATAATLIAEKRSPKTLKDTLIERHAVEIFNSYPGSHVYTIEDIVGLLAFTLGPTVLSRLGPQSPSWGQSVLEGAKVVAEYELRDNQVRRSPHFQC